MSRLIGAAVGGALALSLLAACSDSTRPEPTVNAQGQAPSLASGSTGGGGGGAGGTVSSGGGAVRPCAILTFGIVNNLLLSTSVPSFWLPNTAYMAQATGSTEKSCDTMPGAVMKFADITGTGDGCDASVPQFVGATYVKYGLKPMSRYAVPFIYYTGADCLGHPRTIRATLIDQSTGAVLSSATANWTP